MTGTTMERPAVRRRRDGVAIGLTVWGVLVFAFLFLPILVMLVYSFNTGRLLATWQGFGFDAYANAWANPVIRASVVTSLEAAVGAALVSTLLGTLGGLALARAARRAPWVLWATLLLTITLFTPEIVDAISMLPWSRWPSSPSSCGPGCKAWTSRWRRPRPTSTPLRSGASGRSPCRWRAPRSGRAP